MLSTAEFQVYSDYLQEEFGVVVVDVSYEERTADKKRVYGVVVGIPTTARAMRIKLVERYNEILDTERVLTKMVDEVQKWLRQEGWEKAEGTRLLIPDLAAWKEAERAPISWSAGRHVQGHEDYDETPGFFTDYIIAFREWNFNPAINNLGPIGSGAWVWDGRNEIEARHAGATHPAPHPDCPECGIFAKYEPVPVREGHLHRDWDAQTFRVSGAIAVRGRVQSHQNELRAQYARPLCLTYEARPAVEYLRVEGEAIKSPKSLEVKQGNASSKVAREEVVRLVPGHERPRFAAERLGLPLVPFRELLEWCEQHGQVVAPEWRGPAPKA